MQKYTLGDTAYTFSRVMACSLAAILTFQASLALVATCLLPQR
jgi:hypothetical protein